MMGGDPAGGPQTRVRIAPEERHFATPAIAHRVADVRCRGTLSSKPWISQ
jgi:hypothetical protein